jgi:hypothetical protein
VPVAEAVAADVSRAGATFTSAILPRIIGSATFFAGEAPNLTPVHESARDGRLVDASAAATVRLSRSLMLDVSYLFDRLRDAQSGGDVYSNTIVRIRVGEQFTRAASLRTIVQRNQLTADARQTLLRPDRSVNVDVLFSYLTSPGTAVYAGANYNLASPDRSPALVNTGWQVFTKISYLVRR